MLIKAITTNHGKTIDQYTIYFYDGSCLTLSSNPDSALGFSQWSEFYGINDSHFEEATESKGHVIPGTAEKLINYFELPSVVKSHIEKRISESK